MPMHWNIFPTSEPERPPARDESVRRYGIIVNEPGQEYVYSNFAYGVLDQVITRVSANPTPNSCRGGLRAVGHEPDGDPCPSELAAYAVQNYDEAGTPCRSWPTIMTAHRPSTGASMT